MVQLIPACMKWRIGWSPMDVTAFNFALLIGVISSVTLSDFSLVGMMHAWKFANGDTALNIPLLDWLAGEPIAGGWGNLVPAWPFAVAYALITGLLLFAQRFGVPALEGD